MMKAVSRRAALAICASMMQRGLTAAENYPSHSVKIVVPFPAGGSNDIIARILAQKLSERTGQQFFVENRGGAGGNIGADAVAKSAADGYTLLVTAPPPLTTNAALYKSLPFNPETDFAPVALLATVPIVLMVHPSVPAKNVQELVALAKAKPGTLNFGSSGIGTTNHLAGELLKRMTGIDIVHVPYKGAAPAMTDLIGRRIQLMFDNLASSLVQIKAGKVRALAVTTAKRTELAPDLPTIAESGLPGFDINTWFGLFVPARTPPAIVQRLHDEFVKALETPEVRARMLALGAEPVGSTPAQFAQYVQSEAAKYAKLVKASGARAD